MSTFPLFMINEFNFLYLIQSIGYLRAEKESYFYRDICRRVYLIIPTVEQSFSTTTTSWYLFGVIHIFIIASVVNSSIITYIHIFIIGHLKSNITFTVLIYDRDNSTFYYAHSDTSETAFKKTKLKKNQMWIWNEALIKLIDDSLEWKNNGPSWCSFFPKVWLKTVCLGSVNIYCAQQQGAPHHLQS